jgi:hypothetical protein
MVSGAAPDEIFVMSGGVEAITERWQDVWDAHLCLSPRRFPAPGVPFGAR